MGKEETDSRQDKIQTQDETRFTDSSQDTDLGSKGGPETYSRRYSRSPRADSPKEGK